MLELPIECLNERFCVQVAICRQPLVDPITENVTRERSRPTFRFPKPMSGARLLHVANSIAEVQSLSSRPWEDERGWQARGWRTWCRLIDTHKPYTIQQRCRI